MKIGYFHLPRGNLSPYLIYSGLDVFILAGKMISLKNELEKKHGFFNYNKNFPKINRHIKQFQGKSSLEVVETTPRGANSTLSLQKRNSFND